MLSLRITQDGCWNGVAFWMEVRFTEPCVLTPSQTQAHGPTVLTCLGVSSGRACRRDTQKLQLACLTDMELHR